MDLPGLPRVACNDRFMTWVYAHRGASATFAEHTRAAIISALDQGADGIEVDLRLTKDGAVVLAHDATMRRIAGSPLRISHSTLAQLQDLDIGSWHSGTATANDRATDRSMYTRIMTLHELLELVVDHPRRPGLLLETKHPAQGGALLEPCVATVLRRFGLHDARATERPPISVMSFSAAALRRLRDVDSGITRTLLMRPPRPIIRASQDASAPAALGPSAAMFAREIDQFRQWQNAGGQVYVWTVNEPNVLRLCQSLPVDIVITDRPAWAAQLLT